MTAKIPVSVLGATGTVGQKFIHLLGKLTRRLLKVINPDRGIN